MITTCQALNPIYSADDLRAMTDIAPKGTTTIDDVVHYVKAVLAKRVGAEAASMAKLRLPFVFVTYTAEDIEMITRLAPEVYIAGDTRFLTNAMSEMFPGASVRVEYPFSSKNGVYLSWFLPGNMALTIVT